MPARPQTDSVVALSFAFYDWCRIGDATLSTTSAIHPLVTRNQETRRDLSTNLTTTQTGRCRRLLNTARAGIFILGKTHTRAGVGRTVFRNTALRQRLMSSQFDLNMLSKRYSRYLIPHGNHLPGCPVYHRCLRTWYYPCKRRLEKRSTWDLGLRVQRSTCIRLANINN